MQTPQWRGGSGNSLRGGQPLTLGSLARARLINDTCHSVRREGWVHDVWPCWEAGEIDCLAWSAFLSLFLSLTRSSCPAIRVQDTIKKRLKCCVCARELANRPALLFILLFLTLSLSLYRTILFKKGKRKQANEGKKREKNICMRKRKTSAKKTWLGVAERGQWYQSKSTSATTRLLFQIKTTYGRQMTLTQERNLKRLDDRNSTHPFSSILKAHPFYCKSLHLLFFPTLSHAILFLNTLAVGAWHLQSAFKEKNVSRKRDPPPSLSLFPSLSLSFISSLAGWHFSSSLQPEDLWCRTQWRRKGICQ